MPWKLLLITSALSCVSQCFDLLPHHHLVPSVPDDTAFSSNVSFPFLFDLSQVKISCGASSPGSKWSCARWQYRVFSLQYPSGPSATFQSSWFVRFSNFHLKHPFLFLTSFLLHWLCPFCFVSVSRSHPSASVILKDSFKVSVCSEITSRYPFLWQVHVHRDLYIWITSENHCKRFLHRWLYLFTGSVELVRFQCHHDGVSSLLTLLMFWVWWYSWVCLYDRL